VRAADARPREDKRRPSQREMTFVPSLLVLFYKSTLMGRACFVCKLVFCTVTGEIVLVNIYLYNIYRDREKSCHVTQRTRLSCIFIFQNTNL
jgi:hypothetical protein